MTARARTAAALRETARYLRVTDPRSFRARAYERGAAAVEAAASFGELVRERRLESLPGIGASLAGVIEEIATTGTSRTLERLRGEIPAAVVELASVRGISVPRAQLLYKELGIETVEDLERACREGRVRAVRGLGPKTEQRLMAAVRTHVERSRRVVLHEVTDLADEIEAWAREAPGAVAASLAGSVRRRVEVLDAIDVVVAAEDADAVERHLREHRRAVRGALRRAPAEDGARRIELAAAPPIRLVVSPPERFGTELVWRSGCADHVAELASRARERGLDLADWDEASEQAIYARLGLPWLPPEVREGAGEIDLAAAGDDFSDLVRVDDVRGAVHCHTTDSDGRLGILDMARAAAARGFAYLTITNHSASAPPGGATCASRSRSTLIRRPGSARSATRSTRRAEGGSAAARS